MCVAVWRSLSELSSSHYEDKCEEQAESESLISASTTDDPILSYKTISYEDILHMERRGS
jgi:hypothetical protein